MCTLVRPWSGDYGQAPDADPIVSEHHDGTTIQVVSDNIEVGEDDRGLLGRAPRSKAADQLARGLSAPPPKRTYRHPQLRNVTTCRCSSRNTSQMNMLSCQPCVVTVLPAASRLVLYLGSR